MVDKSADVRVAPPFFVASQTLDDGDTMNIDPGSIDKFGPFEVHVINHENDGDVKLELDSTGDGSYDRSVTLDSVSGNGVSQGNSIEVGAASMRFQFSDTSGGSGNDVIVTGELL